ncbi:MAG: ATP-binding cassette domain-containing protein, partial [Synergistes sp.]|nr:ATP-binding cassette domain-containing protein [Synergistes sp.]
MIKIEHLGKYYGKHKVLSDISLEVGKGDVFGIVGHSGAGKSTLLRCLNGLEPYSEGSVVVDGKEVKDLNEAQIK